MANIQTKLMKLKFCSALLISILLAFCSNTSRASVPVFPGGGFGPTNTPLDSWSFEDSTGWTSDFGYAPVSFTNLSWSYMGDGSSLVLDTNIPAWLQYNVFESDGTTNLTVDSGTVTFWFGPNWSSADDTNGGFGPGEYGRLFEVGSYTSDSSYGWWSLFVDCGGTNLYFAAQTNDLSSSMTVYLTTPIDWTTNYFHFVALTYSPTNTAIYLDGVLATNGPGVTLYPGPDVLANGFYIGSDSNGVLQAHGLFNKVQTYSYPLSSNDVQTLFNWNYGTYMMTPWNYAMWSIVSAPSSPSIPYDTYDIITGTGNLQQVASVTAISNTNVWITNVVVTVSGSGTNNMSLQFTIQGGFDGYPYDTFVNSVLNFSSNTNLAWAWMGQGFHGNTYKISNLPNTACFLILGTPQDSDGDGLTDAYELLVSKTNPYIADTSGDGVSDSDKILDGLNPLGYYPQWKLDSDDDSLPDAYEQATSGLNYLSAEPPPGLPSFSAVPVP
jgi:hypothetical protein